GTAFAQQEVAIIILPAGEKSFHLARQVTERIELKRCAPKLSAAIGIKTGRTHQLPSFWSASHRETVVGKCAKVTEGVFLAGTVGPDGILPEGNGQDDVIELVHTGEVGQGALLLIA